MRTVNDVINALPSGPQKRLPDQLYTNGPRGPNVMLAVSSMQYHTTDEGWQIAQALQYAGYELAGNGCLQHNTTDVGEVLKLDPTTVVMQDKREWDVRPGDFRDASARFNRVEKLAARPDVFKLTILKDAHQRPDYHRQSAEEIGCHAWIIYYHRRIVKHVAPYVRMEHCVRTYHTVNSALVPSYTPEYRRGCILSGAVSGAYPLRQRLFLESSKLPETTAFTHPGYHRNGSATPDYLRILSRFKVAICTSSIYGYALRKLIEATACGCRVITDLPIGEHMPAIDDNLVRIEPSTSTEDMGKLVKMLIADYDTEKQKYFSEEACRFYDYRSIGRMLARDIEVLRKSYHEEVVKC